MPDESATLPEIKPMLQARRCGGWLALTPNSASIRIAVPGATEEEARDGLRLALAIWEANLAAANKRYPHG